MTRTSRTRRSLALVPLVLSLTTSTALAHVADSIRYATRVAAANQLGVALTNYGFLGNNFVSRAPSLEYPLGTSFEHLVRGGVWIGARALDDAGAFTGVTTGCLDGLAGSSSPASSEFTPAGLDLVVRSRLATSPDYDPLAISDQDVECTFSDEPAKLLSPESHRPLDVRVRQVTHAWSVGDLGHVLFVSWTVVNQGPPLEDAWVGLYTELASGSRNDYSVWPPTSSGGTTGGWFAKSWIQYDDSLRLLREHYCDNLPVPTGCNLAHVPSWVGVRPLGLSPGSLADPNHHVTLAAWNYGPGDPARDQDVERYAIMSAGTIQDLSGFLPVLSDPIELIAVGPFPRVESGDSVTVTFALVGGAEIGDVQQHARAAQAMYDAGYDLTVPVAVSLVSAEAVEGRVRLAWTVAGDAGAWTVLRTRDGLAWDPVGSAGADGTGEVRFEDSGVSPGARYGYRLRSTDGATFGEAWVDVPAAPAFALLGARPNPARPGGLRVAFTLAGGGPVRLEILDVAGRRVLARDLGDLAPGSHVIELGRGDRLAPGTCFLRLTQGARTSVARAVVLD